MEYIKVFECDSLGNCVEASKTLADIAQLRLQWNLPVSDMRMFLQSHKDGAASDGLPALSARPASRCFLANFENIKLLCKSDLCVVLHSEDLEVQQFVADLRRQLGQKSSGELAANPGGQLYSNMHFLLLGAADGKEEEEVPKLEFAVIETLLSTVTSKFRRHLALLRPILNILQQKTLSHPRTGILRRMLAFMKNLNAFETSVTMVRNAVVEILQEERDLAGLCLSGLEEEKDRDQMELLLEAYTSDLKEICYEVANIKEQIDDTNEFMNIHLNTVRNSFMKVSMVVDIGTLLVGSGALVAGFFGMNVPSGFEQSPSTFAITSLSTVIGIVTIALLVLFLVKRFTTLDGEFVGGEGYRAMAQFFDYAKQVERARRRNDGRGGDVIGNRRDFRKVIEPVVGAGMTEYKLGRVFRALFLQEENEEEEGKENHASRNDEDELYLEPKRQSSLYYVK